MEQIDFAAEAATILDYYRTKGRRAVDLPDGWSYLGAGMYRSVYRSPSGFAYKIDQTAGQGYGGNAAEWRHYQTARKAELPNRWRIVTLDLLNVMSVEGEESVIVAECIIGTRENHVCSGRRADCEDCRSISQMSMSMICGDFHPGNYICVTDETTGRVRERVLVDIGI